MKNTLTLIACISLTFMMSCEEVYDKELLSNRPSVLVESRFANILSPVEDGLWIAKRTTLYDSVLIDKRNCQDGITGETTLVKFDLDGNITDTQTSSPDVYFQEYGQYINPVRFVPQSTGSLSATFFDEKLKVARQFVVDIRARLDGFSTDFSINGVKNVGRDTFMIPFTLRNNKSYKVGFMWVTNGEILSYFESAVYEADFVNLGSVSEDNLGNPLFLIATTVNQKSTTAVFTFNEKEKKITRDFEFASSDGGSQFYNVGNKEGIYVMPRTRNSKNNVFEVRFYSFTEKKFLPNKNETPVLPGAVSDNWNVGIVQVSDKNYLQLNGSQNQKSGLYSLSTNFTLEPVFLRKASYNQLRVQPTPNGLIAYETGFKSVGERYETYLYIHKSLQDVKKIQLTESIKAPPSCSFD